MGKNISRARIYLDCKELATFVFIATQDFPKGVKYTLGGEMHRAAILALRGIVAAYNFRDLERGKYAN